MPAPCGRERRCFNDTPACNISGTSFITRSSPRKLAGLWEERHSWRRRRQRCREGGGLPGPLKFSSTLTPSMQALCGLVRRFRIGTSVGSIPQPPSRRRPSPRNLARHLTQWRAWCRRGRRCQKMTQDVDVYEKFFVVRKHLVKFGHLTNLNLRFDQLNKTI